MEQSTNLWNVKLNKALPNLALIAPLSWFAASIIYVLGIGRLPGGLSIISSHEGFLMTLGSPFFIATFIFLGQSVARQFPMAGIAVTVLGSLGVTTLSAISAFRLFATSFVNYGIDPDTINGAFNAGSGFDIAFALLQVSGFLSFIISGVAFLRSDTIPKWVGLLLIASIPFMVTGQFFEFKKEIFWPLATLSWVLAMWGLGKSIKTKHV
jgi:hypothetical protein